MQAITGFGKSASSARCAALFLEYSSDACGVVPVLFELADIGA